MKTRTLLTPDNYILRPDINILKPDNNILRPDIDILRLDINIVSLDIQSDGCISHLLSNLADLQNDARQLSSS